MADILRQCRVGDCSFRGTNSEVAQHWSSLHHQRGDHGKRITCENCQLSVSAKKIKRHKTGRHTTATDESSPQQDRVECEVCLRHIPKREIARHKKRLHTTSIPRQPRGQDRGRCRICQKYISKHNLARHEKIHKRHLLGEQEEELAQEQPPEEPPEQPREPQAQQHEQGQATLSSLITSYQESQEGAIQFVSQRLSELMQLAVGSYKDRLTDYQYLLQDAAYGAAVDAETYLRTREADFVLCSPADAQRVLEIGPLRVPIFIPRELASKQHRLESLQKFFATLKLLPTVDAQYQGVEEYCQPTREPSKKVVEDFLSHGKGPINLLNLQGSAYDPPECLCQDRFAILDDVKSEAGKRSEFNPADLSSCTRFRICGSKDSFSPPHVDQNGVITSIFNNEGEKLWLLWPHLTIEDLRNWAPLDLDPEPGPVGIYLRAGDTLIQPSGTLHAPWSITNVLMTGSMHWDVQDMVRTMELTKFCLQNKVATNEDVAGEFQQKVDHIATLWKERTAPWSWPQDEIFGQFMVLKTEVLTSLAAKYTKRRRR